MRATCVRGRLVVRRAFPSFSRIRIVPVSATAKLTPEIPRSASANRRRSACRAEEASVAKSLESSMPSCSANSAAIWPLVLWMAGTTMCDGVSPASWTMYSPKSVSIGSIPRRASPSFRWISSDAMLLLLTTVRAPRCSAIRPMISHASAASRAQCTRAPARSAFVANCSRYRSRCSSVSSLIARARSRAPSQSGTVASAARRRSPNKSVAWRRAPRSCPSASAVRASRSKLAAMWSARLPGGKNFRQVQGTDGRPSAREATADLHQTAGVAGHHGVHARPLDRVYFFVQHRHRDLRVFHRKRAPEAAARLRVRQLHQLRPLHVAQQAARLVADSQVAQAVTGIVPSEPPGKGGTHVLHAQAVDQEGAELVRPLRQLPRPRAPVLVLKQLLVVV